MLIASRYLAFKYVTLFLPTGFGKSSLTNLTALLVPLLVSKGLRKKNIKIIYHNSVYTNDIRALGYNTKSDKIKGYLLGVVERSLFKNIPTYVMLKMYKDKIDKAIGKNKVTYLNARYLEAISTVYMNGKISHEIIKGRTFHEVPTILMHGYWGPQKNLKLVLSTLRKLKEKGINFKLIISGGINDHFPNFKNEFISIIELYNDIIDSYLGYINEMDIMQTFLKADLLVLPYNTPGGHSGVMEQAIFFEIPTIAINFPEYMEQSRKEDNIILVSSANIERGILLLLNMVNRMGDIQCLKKIITCKNNISTLLDSFDKVQ